MGTIEYPQPVALFCGILIDSDDLLPKVKEELEKLYGKTQIEKGPVYFNHSRYYEEEMGKDLHRYFLGFHQLVLPENLSKIKRECNIVEDLFREGGKRSVNIDPGYLDLPKVILASTKDFSHRLYLGKGIFGEVTLNWRQGRGFVGFPWSYPDYQTSFAKTFFKELREYYERQINGDLCQKTKQKNIPEFTSS